MARVLKRVAELRIDRVFDVVVVGTGGAGFAAALAATSGGASVVMLESSDAIGGTTRKSGAWYWIPNNERMRAAGIEDPREGALEYMARVCRPDVFSCQHPTLGLPSWEYALLSAFYDYASEALEFLHDHSPLRSVEALDFPDYFAHLAENRAPRGRVLVAAAAEGGFGSGEDMISALRAGADRSGIAVLTNCSVEQLVVARGEAVGVVANHHGRALVVGARRATIFASGGFVRNRRLREALLAGPIFGTCASPGSVGTFAEIAEELGAPLRATAYPWLAPCVLERALRGRSEFELTNQPPGDSMIIVNRLGCRVVSEKLQYNELALKQWEWDGQTARYPNLLLFMIWDRSCQERYASTRPNNPIAPTGEDDDHVVTGEDIEELTDAISGRLCELQETVGDFRLDGRFGEQLGDSIARFNKFASSGNDSDFGRGLSPIERHFHSLERPPRAANMPNPTMHPIATTGPYFATIIAPGALDTKGGPLTDPHGRVLSARGCPIARLYGAGNCVASPSGRAYWGAGATIGPALTFGYLAGRAAATEAPSGSQGIPG